MALLYSYLHPHFKKKVYKERGERTIQIHKCMLVMIYGPVGD